ncbi:hypothetical protein AVEN_118428-1 [Araneus ventricosus]|uniref:Uncharacterized protein n=1 Tax=Araneus ventricosus TaxID=182803 RepID=A0A4Y2L7Z2_ARAVE|nr:hypothetical protein AVEN_118428-1 [Araneus ventricosus]
MVGKRVLQGYVWECWGNGAINPPTLATKMWGLGTAGIFLTSLLGTMIWIYPCDVMACRGDYKRTVLGSQSKSSELIDWDRLWCSNIFGISLWSFICCSS